MLKLWLFLSKLPSTRPEKHFEHFFFEKMGTFIYCLGLRKIVGLYCQNCIQRVQRNISSDFFVETFRSRRSQNWQITGEK